MMEFLSSFTIDSASDTAVGTLDGCCIHADACNKNKCAFHSNRVFVRKISPPVRVYCGVACYGAALRHCGTQPLLNIRPHLSNQP
jgi:hypothetical protein